MQCSLSGTRLDPDAVVRPTCGSEVPTVAAPPSPCRPRPVPPRPRALPSPFARAHGTVVMRRPLSRRLLAHRVMCQVQTTLRQLSGLPEPTAMLLLAVTPGTASTARSRLS
jgi:hypothetical protein